MRTSEIRTRWLDYFRRHDHHIADSVSLVSPDPSILFTIAGVVPFIPYIIGTEEAPWPRAASVQKCIRTNDIENVGRTTRHGTFFQMNGNFSFGDYFKEGAIDLAWGLLTGSLDEGGYGLDGDRLWVTIWEEDDETYDIWTKKIGLDPKHIVKLTREEIFWSTGQPGPAGPCAEIHYDRGPEFGPEAVGGNVDPGGDRYLEVWNLVFDQYLRGEGAGSDYPLLGELDRKAIDTGAGLERIAYLLQGKNNMYEIDEVFPVIQRTEELTGKTYGADTEDDVKMRIIADHVRSSLMLIGDGVRPGNDGRGYVLRRLIRRAVRSVRLLGVDEVAMPALLPVSKDVMAASYPGLETDFDRISQIAYAEEEAFRRTLQSGTAIFEGAVRRLKSSGATPVLTGSDAFTLHDTYGFPIDLTLEMAEEAGVQVDADGFTALMKEQKERARADAQAKKTGHVDVQVYSELLGRKGKTQFLGYTDTATDGRVIGILVDGQPSPAAEAPAEIEVILDQTPFWAEQGGQLADHGTISVAGGGLVDVHDVQSPVKGLIVHRGTLTEGAIALEDTVHAQIDVTRRGQIARAHTATHMVHKALHEHLGEQATQAGSENSPSRMRFDFRHGQQVPTDILSSIEARVNERLQENLSVTDEVMSLDEAKKQGATALFGEKYGDVVRVVSIGGEWSKELCAGTHVPETGTIGLVSVLGEASIGSGVRRIDALVGAGAYAEGAKERAILSQVSSQLGARTTELPDRIAALMNRLKAAEKELAAMRTAQLMAGAEQIAQSATRHGDVLYATKDLGDGATGDDLRTLALDVRARLGSEPAVVAIFGQSKGRPTVVIATNEAAREKGVKAGALVKVASGILGGGGGGKDDVAQGGGQDASKIAEASAAVASAL
ncbi:alanine--tRNA ligase [Flaviflexus salsibiostraticola]|uniref:Alanine--tRNA ligase n=1 Tax=Flaviflexus salsibiostraticola TaxID=1282737 RepID=A0A3S8Z750_9ACTO|nr:alanine--tRNA ligase [Flaviflexus salsibiostraticola]AZN29254.1 alanine--tRNA ligase [Flaviflexus salsibiostraticola]